MTNLSSSNYTKANSKAGVLTYNASAGGTPLLAGDLVTTTEVSTNTLEQGYVITEVEST